MQVFYLNIFAKIEIFKTLQGCTLSFQWKPGDQQLTAVLP